MRESPIVVQGRVISALILRDVKTRFGGNPANYMVAIAWPLTHIAVLLLVYAAAGRVAPYGTSTVLFFATGVLPFIIFNYPSRFAMMSLLTNTPLLGFPIVTLFDVIMARVLLEIVTAISVVLIVCLALVAMDVDVVPANPAEAIGGLAATLLLACGFGFLNALIVKKVPGYFIGWILFQVVTYVLSGIVFLPDSLPKWIMELLAYNPLLHGVSWVRAAYYPGYGDLYLSRTYLVMFGMTVLVAGIVMERLSRRWLLSS